MARVFISYSSKDERLVEKFIEFLQLGMGVSRNNIFCTAFEETLTTGEAFIENIRKGLEDCEAVISIITEEYLKSKFCMIEMGAAWAMSKRYFPMILIPVDRLNKTPLYSMQMRKLNDSGDISTVYDELFECGISEKRQTAQFNKRLPEFIRQTDEICNGDYIIEKDEDGYYETVIKEVRKVKENYRCYGIKGHIAEPPDGEQANSDWIFYWRDMFPDLQVGERVRFKVSKSEVKIFSDLGRARNLYPADLKKVDFEEV